MHGEVKVEGSIEHIRVIQSVIVGDEQASVVPKVPLVGNGRVVEEMAGIMNEDIEENGEVSEEGFIRRVPVILLGHGHEYRDLICYHIHVFHFGDGNVCPAVSSKDSHFHDLRASCQVDCVYRNSC